MEPNAAESGKRKVDFVTLPKQVPPSKTLKIGTSKFSDSKTIDSNKSENGDNVVEDQSANSSINRYLSALKQKMKSADSQDSEKLVEKLLHEIENLKSNNPNFLKKTHFKNLLDFYANEIESFAESAMVIKSHHDLLKELHRMSTKISTPQTMSTQRVDASYIQKLTISLQKVLSRIDKAQSKELSLDDLEHDNEFTKLPVLYKAALKLWRKRETLLHRSTLTGHYMYAKLEYHGTDNSLVNNIVKNLFNQYLNCLKKNEEDDQSTKNPSKIKHKPAPHKHFSFFTIIELKKKLSKAIGDNPDIKNFELTDKVLSKIYKDLLSEIKKRRQNSQKESLRVLELSGDNGPKTVTEEQNSEIVAKLDLSEKRGMEALEELMRIFREKDLQQNKNQNDNENDDKPLGWDDKDEENEEDPEASDEAEAIEEDASSSSDYYDDDDDNGITITEQSDDCRANNNEKSQTNDAKGDEPEASDMVNDEIIVIESDESDDDENCQTITEPSDISNSNDNPQIQTENKI